jgi:hypothetical protein
MSALTGSGQENPEIFLNFPLAHILIPSLGPQSTVKPTDIIASNRGSRDRLIHRVIIAKKDHKALRLDKQFKYASIDELVLSRQIALASHAFTIYFQTITL